MEIQLVESPDKDLIDFFDKRIEEFNVARWEIKKKKPIVVKVVDQSGKIVGGAAGKSFGMWLLNIRNSTQFSPTPSLPQRG